MPRDDAMRAGRATHASPSKEEEQTPEGRITLRVGAKNLSPFPPRTKPVFTNTV